MNQYNAEGEFEDDQAWVSTAEAARRLGVKPATVYAYVSRGLLHSRRAAGGRGSELLASEVESLRTRTRRARPDPGSGTDAEPLIISRITRISDDRLHYRGRDVGALAGVSSFEAVAELLWQGRLGRAAPWTADPRAVAVATAAQSALPGDTLPLERLWTIVCAAATVDALRQDLRAGAIVAGARGIIATMVEALPCAGRSAAGTGVGFGGQDAHGREDTAGRPEAVPGRQDADSVSLAQRLWPRLCPAPATEPLLRTLDAALVLLADHELAASTLAARVVASARADPYAVVLAGLAALSGTLHGASSLAIEDLLAEIPGPEDAAGRVARRLRGGVTVPGFGQPLYPGGDPRATRLLSLLEEAAGETARFAVVRSLERTVSARGLPPPNVDFALAALAHTAGMRRGAAETVFAVARTAGWLAHAMEQYAEGGLIRLRARYAGPEPETP